MEENGFENESNNASISSSSVDLDSYDDTDVSGYEEEESGESEGISEVDYTDLLTCIDGNITDITAQIDVLNENVNVLNENIKFCTCLVFVVVVFLLIKCAYHILGSVLGLNKA